MALSEGSPWKLTHTPKASYLTQKENQYIITTWSRLPFPGWLQLLLLPAYHLTPATLAPSLGLKHAAALPPWSLTLRQAGPVSDALTDAIFSAGKILSPRICKAVPSIFLQGSAQVPLSGRLPLITLQHLLSPHYIPYTSFSFFIFLHNT